MFKRDYLVKQFEEFGKVMAVLLGLKRDGLFPELEEAIQQAARKYTSTEIDYTEALDHDSLIHTLTIEKALTDEQLKMLADLLFEKAEYYLNQQTPSSGLTSVNCCKKSFLIYTFLKEHATLNYSLDMHYKLQILEKMAL